MGEGSSKTPLPSSSPSHPCLPSSHGPYPSSKSRIPSSHRMDRSPRHQLYRPRRLSNLSPDLFPPSPLPHHNHPNSRVALPPTSDRTSADTWRRDRRSRSTRETAEQPGMDRWIFETQLIACRGFERLRRRRGLEIRGPRRCQGEGEGSDWREYDRSEHVLEVSRSFQLGEVASKVAAHLAPIPLFRQVRMSLGQDVLSLGRPSDQEVRGFGEERQEGELHLPHFASFGPRN